MRRIPGENSEFVFLSSFMDGELDCDKMDYLLRDSLYCGVNYGKYDVQRLISCLTVYREEGGSPRLAVKHGGVQAFEEFVLARYFMFVQVYFHRTRRYFDIMLKSALEKILDNGKYPENIEAYLSWDDCKVIELMKEYEESIKEYKLLASDEEKVNFVFQNFIKKNVFELEAITTLDYVATFMLNNAQSDSQIIEEVKKIKGSKFKEDYLEKQLAILKKCGYVA